MDNFYVTHKKQRWKKGTLGSPAHTAVCLVADKQNQTADVDQELINVFREDILVILERVEYTSLRKNKYIMILCHHQRSGKSILMMEDQLIIKEKRCL